MKALDLFCGAGGLALGAKQAGISIIQSVELDKQAAATYSNNFPETNLLLKDIRDIGASDISFKPDLVFGGPPCQGYSTSNQRTRSKSNPNNWLFTEFLRIISIVEPTWVLIENVKGLIETENKFFLNEIQKDLSQLSYHTSFYVLNAVDFGVPQKRSRLFIVGTRYKNIKLHFKKKSKEVTVRDALGDLPSLPNGANFQHLAYKNNYPSEYAQLLRGNLTSCTNHLVTFNSPHIIERYKHVPQGGNWENIPKQMMQNYKNLSGCHTGIYHRLVNDRPSVVIGNYRKNMLIHPDEDRGLSVREAARIQSFPDWFEFKGSIGFQQQQVGNAVPPFLAMQVFNSILSL